MEMMSFCCLRKLEVGHRVYNAYNFEGITRVNCPMCEAGVAVVELEDVKFRNVGNSGEERVNGTVVQIKSISGCPRRR